MLTLTWAVGYVGYWAGMLLHKLSIEKAIENVEELWDLKKWHAEDYEKISRLINEGRL